MWFVNWLKRLLWGDDTKTTTPSSKTTTSISRTKNTSTNELPGSTKKCIYPGTTILTASGVDSNIKNQFELSPGTISSIILGICLFLLILGIILKNMPTFLKKKKRKTPNQENDNNTEDLYAEIDGSMIDPHVAAERMNERLSTDTGEYNHLSEIRVTEQKTKGRETDLVLDSSGYSHVLIKDGRSEPLQMETDLSNTIKHNSSQYQQLIAKEGNITNLDVISGEDHGTKNHENLYALENVTSDESNVGKEEDNVYQVFESVTYEEISGTKGL